MPKEFILRKKRTVVVIEEYKKRKPGIEKKNKQQKQSIWPFWVSIAWPVVAFMALILLNDYKKVIDVTSAGFWVLVALVLVALILLSILLRTVWAHGRKQETFLTKYLGVNEERVKTYRAIPAGLLAVMTALIAVWGVVYSVQMTTEESRDARIESSNAQLKSSLQDRFAVATEQLESESVISKINAINTLALLADEWQQHADLDPGGAERSICIEAIVSYLKKPVDYDDEVNDRTVRETISRQLENHLNEYKKSFSWLDYPFNFSRATFYDIYLNSAAFHQNISFEEATFKGNVDFSKVTFQGNASFSGATFEGNARFNGAFFSFSSEFRKVTFEGYADFHGAIFPGHTFFSEATFEGDADFSEATFVGYTFFNEATFEGDADYDGAVFSEVYKFYGCSFVEEKRVTFPKSFEIMENGLPRDARWVEP